MWLINDHRRIAFGVADKVYFPGSFAVPPIFRPVKDAQIKAQHDKEPKQNRFGRNAELHPLRGSTSRHDCQVPAVMERGQPCTALSAALRRPVDEQMRTRLSA